MSPQLPTVLLRAQTDERLARLAALGSERAFEAIVERYRRPLLGYARRIAGESRAEDIVQAAFVGAWGRLAAGTEVRDLRAWLFRIVHNGAINTLKRASASDVELFDDTPGTGDLHDEIERRDDVRRALDGIAALPLQQREALLGVAVQGRRHRDVGAELGVTDGAVRMLLHRARSTMRTAATALTPWPLVAWLSGAQGGAGGAGAGVLAFGGLKAAAVLSTAAVAVTAAPQIASRAQEPARPPATTAAALTAPQPGGAGAGPLAADSPSPDRSATAPARAKRSPADKPGPADLASPPPGSPGSPAPAPAPADPAPGVVQQEDSTSIAPSRDHLAPASDEDDEIAVQEEAPDLAAGERPIPAGGVPDDVAEAALPEQPAAAEDQRELDAAEAPPPAAPAPAPDPVAGASAAPDAAPAS